MKKPAKVVGKIAPARTVQRPSKLPNFDDGNESISRDGISRTHMERANMGDLSQMKGENIIDFARIIDYSIQAVEESKAQLAFLQAEGILTDGYRSDWAAWVKSVGTLIDGMANELEAHPDILSAVARVETLREFEITQTSDVLNALRGMAQGYYTTGDLENPDKAAHVIVIIAIIAAIIVVGVIVVVSQETLQDLINHTNSAARLAMLNSCLANARTPEERDQCLRAGELTRPQEKKFPWLFVGIGVVAIGAGYWYYMKKKGSLADFEEFEDTP